MALSDDRGAAQRIDAAADEAGTGIGWPVGERGDSIAAQGNRAVARRIRQMPQRQCAERRLVLLEPGRQIEQVHVEPGIAVEQQERLVEPISCPPQRSAGSGRFRFDHHLDVEAEALLQRCRGGVLNDSLGRKPGKQQDSPDPVPTEFKQRHIEERCAADLQQRFGRVGGQRPEARAASAAKNDRLFQHGRHLSDRRPACQAPPNNPQTIPAGRFSWTAPERLPRLPACEPATRSALAPLQSHRKHAASARRRRAGCAVSGSCRRSLATAAAWPAARRAAWP